MFKGLFGGSADATDRHSLAARLANLRAPSPGQPTHAEVVLRRLGTAFHVHDEVEGVRGHFLTAVTDGLIKSRQRELVLTLRLTEGEDPIPKMQDILRFVATAQAWARQRNTVDEGSFTQFGERGLFGRSHAGLLYADARSIAGIRLPERALAAICVDASEIRAAHDYGTYRVLGRIGLQSGLFPYPIWSDLSRPSTVTAQESDSLLTRAARVHAPGVYFVKTEQGLRVSIPPDTTQLLKGLRALPLGAPFVLLTRLAPDANSILVWSPASGTTGFSPAGSDGSRQTGSCLMVVPGASGDQARQLEDGYSVRFSHESWAKLSAALAARRAIAVPLAGAARFELAWLPKEP